MRLCYYRTQLFHVKPLTLFNSRYQDVSRNPLHGALKLSGLHSVVSGEPLKGSKRQQ